MGDKDNRKYRYKALTDEELARAVEQNEKYVTEYLVNTHFECMAKSMRELQKSYDDLNKNQRKERLLKINEHLQEILKERPVLTSSDYDAMDYHALISHRSKIWKQIDQIQQLDPSVGVYYTFKTEEVNDEKETDEKKSEKSCWEKFKGASAELVKKIVKKNK